MNSQRRLVLILGIVVPLLSLLSNSAQTKVRRVEDEPSAHDWALASSAPGRASSGPNARFGLLFNRLALPAVTEAAWTRPFAMSPQSGTTFTVNSTADPGTGTCDATECTLREAITAANAHPGTDTIAFDIPGTGPFTITPTSPLPSITVAGGPVIIDGYTQPGASVNTLADGDNAVLMIVLDGSAATSANSMISISAGSSTVRGLVINRMNGNRAINLDTNGGNTIEGNFLGVDVAGTAISANGYGVMIFSGSNNIIGGTTPAARNVISGNNTGGIALFGGTGHLVEGNFIGTDRTGSNDLGNAIGINISASTNNTIGGTTAGARNVISGNGTGVSCQASNNLFQGNYFGTSATGGAFNYSDVSSVGISLFNGSGNTIGGTAPGAGNVISGHFIGISLNSTPSPTVQGNFIGTDATGTVRLGNSGWGINMQFSNNTVIGGTTPGAGNLISANGTGIEVMSLGTVGAVLQIQGNLIGTDVNGTADLGNTGDGILIGDSNSRPTNITIGGTTAGARNVVSGNDGDGIDLRNVSGAAVQGNLIGTQIDGTSQLGNGERGVNLLNSVNCTIGGTTTGAGNRIAFNGANSNFGGGLLIGGLSSNNDSVRGNSIFANTSNGAVSGGGAGIDLSSSGGDGPTANDSCDGDTGPNSLQNYPVITAVTSSGSTTTIQGTLNSTANTSFTIELFSSPSCDPTGYGEGQTFLGSATAATDASCSASFNVTLPVAVANGQAITATATDSAGNTSEFSQCFQSTRVNVITSNNDSFSTDEDTLLNQPAPGVLSNDTSTDPATLNAQLVTGTAHGTLTLNPNGSFAYAPAANYNGADSFTYRASDGVNTSNTATVQLNINAVNDAPVADSQSVTTDEDTAKAITLTGSDVEGSALAYSVVTGPSHGTLSGTAPNLTYTPAANYNGADSFTFRTNDGQLDSNTATVSININSVNDAPVANDQSVTTDEDTAKAITLAGSDVDGDTLTFSIVTNPSHGTLSGTGASRTYMPAPDYNGTDSFTFKTNDGTVDSNTAAVSITINAVNDPPVANSQSVATDEDTPKAITLSGSDVEGSPLTFAVVTGPSHGTLSGAAPSLTYTPDSNYNGADSFTFKTNDGALDSTPATVSITVNAVNDAPTANPQSLSTSEDTALQITLAGADIETAPANLTFNVTAQPAHGTLGGAAPNLTYTPNKDFNGADSFKFTVRDTGDGASQPLTSAEATVSITINAVNDAPIAANDTATTNENTPLQIAAPGVLSNDTDVDSPTLTAIKVSNPANGTLTLNQNGSFTYTPNRNFSGTDSFTYKANDGQLDSNVATVTITVNAVNSAPVAVDDSYTVAGNSVLTVSSPGVLSNDTDAEHDPLTASLVSSTSNGTLNFNPDGSFTYTPRITNGTDSFTYRARDGQLDSNLATVNITVTTPPTTVQFESALYQVQEDCTGIPVKVTRTGSLTAQTTVDYMTADGTAEQRSDYTLASGRLTFAPGETTKVITLLISEDSFVEGPEFFTISLSNVTGASLGSISTATVQILDDPAEPPTNAIDQKNVFVCQHYHDFLNREPEPAGLLGWQEILSRCAPSDIKCDRIEVSSAFYRSDEFQQRGFFLYRFYATALGRAPHYLEFMTDLSRTTGFLTDQQIEAGKVAFVEEFVSRQEFKNRYDSLTDAAAYVNALETTAKVTLSSKQQLIDDLKAGRRTRTDVLRAVVESTEVSAKCFNEAFVVMQYFGYLRRDPDILYLDWIKTLNQTNDYRTLVNGFVNSLEYRSRFGKP